MKFTKNNYNENLKSAGLTCLLAISKSDLVDSNILTSVIECLLTQLAKIKNDDLI